MHRPAERDAPTGHGFQSAGEGGVWNLWAPRAASVELVLLNAESRLVLPMQPASDGYFTHALDHVPTGQRYLYRLNGERELPDPASRWQPDGVHGPSAVWRPSAVKPACDSWSGQPLEELVLYELHVGTFTPEGTFDAIIPRLAELRSLGITAIELMPVAQFPGSRGWGYDGVYWFAAQQSYGGPDGLLRLVQACHAHQLSVILDVVYNHFGPEGNYLAAFAPCFTTRHGTPWGDAVNFDDAGSTGMRSFVFDNLRYWLRVFHIDGFRLDAVHAIHDDSAVHLVAEIKNLANAESQRLKRPVHVMAECQGNDVKLLDAPECGGYGVDVLWNDDFHHCVHALLTGERDGYYADYDQPARQLTKALNDIFAYDGQFSRFRGRPYGRPAAPHGGHRFVASIQTHDQVGNRAFGERWGTLTPPPAQRLAACLLLLSPFLPLLFMGEEYGECQPFPYFSDFGDDDLRAAVRRGRREEFASFVWRDDVPDPFAEATFTAARLTWTWPEGTPRAGLRRLYHDLLKLRRSQPGLRDDRNQQARLLEDAPHAPLLRLERGALPERVTCLFNLGPHTTKLPTDLRGLPRLLQSEDACYRGEALEPDEAERRWLRPWECFVMSPVA